MFSNFKRAKVEGKNPFPLFCFSISTFLISAFYFPPSADRFQVSVFQRFPQSRLPYLSRLFTSWCAVHVRRWLIPRAPPMMDEDLRIRP
jgi:hypothetical protein